jgi:hypothetical protein
LAFLIIVGGNFMAKQRLTKSATVTQPIEFVFDLFIEEKRATNLADKTITNYRDSYKRVVGYWESKAEYVAQGFTEDISVIKCSQAKHKSL